jgi:hypothetical protein
MQNLFFGSSGHSHAEMSGRAEIFLWLSCRILAAVSPRSIFLAVRSHPRSRQPAQHFFLAVRSHPRSSQPAQNFFWLSGRICAEVSGGAEFFLFCPSGLICAALFDFFFDAWNLCSTLFQNPAQYFFSFYCLKNLLFTAQSCQKFKFFGVFPLTVSGSLTALVRSG